ncbi:hypothetical protein ASZ90_019861 [hydrocarbon metagenome]|uniref:L-2-amino-thiazoline-4-carboxylic acid hydrolase n=1 Tax=hydrocarbon metagenome TaxID=938273 RepID=A0A0W8E2X4_9ZZZZ
MNVVLGLLQLYFPGFIKKKKLIHLINITANAFGCDAPPTKGLTFEQVLQKYALFTKQQAEIQLKDPSNIDHVKHKLYQEAYQLGRELRQEFGITTPKEVMLMSRTIYNILGIDFSSNPENEVIIKRCFFSQYYSPEVCQVISSLDEGLAAGLSDGGNLCFYQRITEGHNCCRANFVWKEDLK